jgi:hypothetical protein
MATAQPQQLPPFTLLGLGPTGRVDIRSGYIQWAGQTFSAIDGSRLLMYATPFGDVYYMQVDTLPSETWKKGHYFVQAFNGYRQDVEAGGVAYHANINLAATKSVLSDFLDIYMGCLAVAGGPLAWSITGMNVLVAGGKIKRNYQLYVDALDAFVSGDMELSRLMPKFYDHMYANLFLARIEADLKGKAKDLLKDAIPAPKAVKGIIGVFLGKVGEDPMKRTLQGIRDIIVDVLFKTMDHVGAGKPLGEDQVKLLAEHHVTKMYAKLNPMGIRREHAEEIIREAARNAARIRPRLQKIVKAVDALAS